MVIIIRMYLQKIITFSFNIIILAASCSSSSLSHKFMKLLYIVKIQISQYRNRKKIPSTFHPRDITDAFTVQKQYTYLN